MKKERKHKLSLSNVIDNESINKGFKLIPMTSMQSVKDAVHYIKVLALLVFLILFRFSMATASAQDLDTGSVTYDESVSDVSNEDLNSFYLKKRNVLNSNIEYVQIDTLKSREGMLTAIYDKNFFMTDGVKHSLYMAMNIWEDKLVFNRPIQFHVSISEDMNEELAISTTVKYFSLSQTAYPQSLFSQTYSDLDNKDCASVKINAYLDWNTSWPYDDDMYSGNLNMTNAFLRSIAHILGFGTSVVKREGGLGYAINRQPSTFDKMISNGVNHLSSTTNLIDFFSHPLCIKSEILEYQLYNNGSFDSGKSGAFFSLGHNNLMEYPFLDKESLLNINNEALNILHVIGWSVNARDFQIVCDKTDVLGYGSLYQNYQFTIKSIDDGANQEASWSYQKFVIATETYETVCSGSGSSFSLTPSVIDESIDANKCVESRVVCMLNGSQYTYPLSFETRPLIESYEINNACDLGNGTYQADLIINGKGSNHGEILVSDNTGTVRQYNIQNTTTTIGPLLKGYTAYIDIRLSNSYGTAVKSFAYEFANTRSLDVESSLKTSVNGNKNQTVLHDGDNIQLNVRDLQGGYAIDSMELGIGMESIKGRRINYILTKNVKDVFMEVTPELFRNKFFTSPDGTTWNDLIGVFVKPDSIHFFCKMYKDKHSYYIQSRNYSIDAIPDIPNIILNKSYLMDYPDDPNGPYCTADITMNANHFKNLELIVNQTCKYCPSYTDTLIRNPQDLPLHTNYTVTLGEWDDSIFCIASNKYGISKSNTVTIGDPTRINTTIGNSMEMSIHDHILDMSFDDLTDICVFSASGRPLITKRKLRNCSFTLQNGIYILSIRNRNTLVLTTKKIMIR